MYLKTILQKVDCEIIECDNGKKAVTLCKEFPDIDLVLMDIQMPIMNGYEATRKSENLIKKSTLLHKRLMPLVEIVRKH